VGDEAWPFDDPPELGIFMTDDLIDGSARPVLIEHDPDGDWSISGGMPFEVDCTRLVHLGWAAAMFEEVRRAAHLPRGRGIELQPSGEWTEHDVRLVD
jgi:hypothetical protein